MPRIKKFVFSRALAASAAALCLSVAADAADAADDGEASALLLPSDRGLRDDIGWLVDRRVLSLPLSTWPLPLATLRPQLDAALKRSWASADADALSRVEAAVQRSLAPYTAGFELNTAEHPSLDGDALARGAAETSAGVRTAGSQWSAKLQVTATAAPISEPSRELSLSGSYAALALPGTLLSLAEVDRWWGPGRYSSPILSNAAAPFPALSVRRTRDDAPPLLWLRWIGPWGYEASLGQLRDYEPRRTRTLGLRVYARPFDGVELGLSRHILWAGNGRPNGWRALSDALLARTNNDGPSDREDPSNELAGFDLRLSHLTDGGWAWIGHAMIIGEDEAGKLPSRRIGTVGAQLKLPFRDGRLEWSAEATDTRLGRLFGLGSDLDRSAYRHGTYVAGYYHQGLPIGAAIGGGGHLLTLGLDWQPACGGATCVRYSGTAFGGRASALVPQDINAAYGARDDLKGLSLKRVSTSERLGWHLGLSLQRYRAGPRADVGLQGGLELPFGAP